MEKIISESIIKDIIKEITEEIQEPGFDNQNPPALPGVEPTEVPINTQGDTNTTDIAQQANKTSFVKNAISSSLPFMMGYVQPLDGPAGFVFGMKQRKDTSVQHQVTPGQPTIPTDPSDEIITRKLIETGIREVVVDFTNEAGEDIQNLFGDNFGDNFAAFQASGGEVWNGQNEPLAGFFLHIGMQRMTNKINKDFTDWLDEVATLKGSSVIPAYTDMANIYGIIGELRESLYKTTHKSGECWVLVSPKIAAFLSSTIGSTMNNSADVYNRGRRHANNTENGYVMTMGDIDVYQYDFFQGNPDVTGGTQSDTESQGIIYMGFRGGPGVSSIFYTPYKEYIVQGGEGFYTGQSNVYYRVRDSWCTNPLDTYDRSQTVVDLGTAGPDPRLQQKSQFINKVEIIFGQQLIT
jgi:hypothetical protein